MPQSVRRCLPQFGQQRTAPLQTAGSSRPSAANVNTLADGADIHGKVALNACTVKEDGTIFPF